MAAPSSPGIAWPALLVGIGLMLGITAYPGALVRADGRADHLAATLLCWAMAAGLVRGVGFIPRHWVPRWLLSGVACALALTLGLLRLIGK